MVIINIALYYFRLPFVSPVRVGNHTLSYREGYLVCLGDAAGHIGYGEIAPLPGLDTTALADCTRDLQAFAARVKGSGGFAVQPAVIPQIPPDLGYAPATCFGLESALLALSVQEKGVEGSARPGEKSVCPGERLAAAVNGLFVPDTDNDVQKIQVDRLLQGGFSTIKVKIGRLSPERETASIRYLHDRCGENTKFRLDGNRSLSHAAYTQYFRELRDLPIEYVEEPLAEKDLARAADVGWPLAIDESLPLYWDKTAGRFAGLPDAVTHAVLKPATPAGFSAVMRFFAGKEHVRPVPVMSTAFNSVYGICALMLYARQVPAATRTAHGLGTGAFLGSDLVRDAPQAKNGCLSVSARILRDARSPDFSQLREVAL